MTPRIYIDINKGSDWNDGLTPETPKVTISMHRDRTRERYEDSPRALLLPPLSGEIDVWIELTDISWKEVPERMPYYYFEPRWTWRIVSEKRRIDAPVLICYPISHPPESGRN